jgi:hypothetical protein
VVQDRDGSFVDAADGGDLGDRNRYLDTLACLGLRVDVIGWPEQIIGAVGIAHSRLVVLLASDGGRRPIAEVRAVER